MSKELSTGLEKAPSRAVLKAMGLSDAEIAKPIIAVITCYNQADPCAAVLQSVEQAVKSGITASGATALTVPCLSLCNGITDGGSSHFSLPCRELIADGVESILGSNSFDGAVLLTGGDETVPGMIMGAVRANIPTAVIGGGPMSGSLDKGIAKLYETVGKVKCGKASITDLTELENGMTDLGSYNGLYTTNALNCVCEALGLSLMGNGSIPSSNPERIRLAKRTGEAVVKSVENDVRPRMILTKDALGNAFALLCAIGGDTNAMLHLLAIAAECETDPKKQITVDYIQEVSNSVPTLFDVTKYSMREFYESGGVAAVLHELTEKGAVKTDCIGISGVKLGTLISSAERSNAIAPIDSPVCALGAIRILKGNIADDCAVIRRTALNANKKFVGKAKCYNSEQECYRALTNGEVQKGDVLVIRYEGPMGGPGMSEMGLIAAAISGMNLADDVAVVTDGRLSSVAFGWAVGHVCPEAANGGKLAYIKNGDKITIDVKEGRLNVDITAKELQARIKKYRPHDDEPVGWLLRYKYAVTSAAGGCVLKKKF